MDRKKNASEDLHYYSVRLKQKLDRFSVSSAVVVEAPSGYGKTTAVQDHLKAALPQSTDIYWFAAVDETSTAGYRRLCRAIEKINGRAGERLLKIGFPNAFTLGEACDALRSIECNRETWLVIDNFQFLCPDLPPSFLAALVEHGGVGLHIAVITQMLGRDYHSAIAGRGFLHIQASDLKLEADDIRRYYSLAGADLTEAGSRKIFSYTEGWIIAVYLQLCAWRETGVFSDTAVLQLMERLIWDRLTGEQQDFLLRLSPFAAVTVRQMCGLLNCGALPDYAADCLSIPFIRYDADQRSYEPHGFLLELTARKRSERDAAFERECLERAGDLCRDEGKDAEALGFYHTIRNYERILSLDLSHVIFQTAGNVTFFEIAQELARNCPEEIRANHPMSMLCVAWALKAAGSDAEFNALMDELDARIDGIGPLRAEWALLSAYRHYPHVDEMLAPVQKASALFGGACSQVILPDAPWAFGGYFQMSEFHLKTGAADREADALGEFIAVYSSLTNGHGSGADALFRAELAYLRGDMAGAEICAYKAAFLAESKRQSIVQLGAAVMLADIAVLRADTPAWQNAIASMEYAASHANQNTLVVRAALDTVRGVLLAELGAQARIADWLKNGAFPKGLPGPAANNAIYAHLIFLIWQRDFARLIGTLEAMPEIPAKSAYSAFVYWLLLAVGYASTGEREKAAGLLSRAAEHALPDAFVTHFAAFSSLLQGLSEELLETKYPQFRDAVDVVKAPFETGWEALHDAMFGGGLPGMTAREREIAELAAGGLRNNEIAQKLFVTENTVRAHLRAIFQKLDIDRRSKLAEKLK
jgi:LuxR family maltose regulon positive regulatory protein